MVRNRRLARVLSDAGLAELRRQLSYKTAWYGSRLVVADRFYPSSKSLVSLWEARSGLKMGPVAR
jgi:putative transposase